MKQTIYIPVKVEEELPVEMGLYMTDYGFLYFFPSRKEWGTDRKDVPNEWLKPVEMPTEDQIIHFMRIGLEYLEDADGSGRFFGEREVAKAITKLMKGER